MADTVDDTVDALYETLEEAERLAASATGPESAAYQRLKALYAHESPEVRQQALYSLNHHHIDIELCIQALQDDDYLVRTSAAEILGNVDTPASSEALIQLLKDPYYAVRATAAEALGQQEAFLAVPALQDALIDADQWVRYSAAESLNQIEPDANVWEYIMFLNSTRNEGYTEALRQLKALADPRAVPTLLFSFKRHVSLQDNILDTLTAMQDLVVIPALIEIAVFTEHPHLRESALLAAQQLSGEHTLRALASWLDPDHIPFAQRAVELIAQFPSDDATPLLLNALKMPDPWVRTVALLTLEKYGVAVDSALLVALLKEPSEDLVNAALTNLSRHHPPLLQRHGQVFLNSKKTWRRQALARALFYAPAESVQPFARALAQDKHSNVRETLFKHLKPHAMVCVELLLEGLQDEDHWVRLQAAESLSAVDTPEVSTALCYALKQDEDFMVRAMAAESLEALTQQPETVKKALKAALEDTADSVRLQVARTLLKRFPDAELFSQLLALDHKAIRLSVLTTLSRQFDLQPLPKSLQQHIAQLRTHEDIQLASAAQQLNFKI